MTHIIHETAICHYPQICHFTRDRNTLTVLNRPAFKRFLNKNIRSSHFFVDTTIRQKFRL